MKARSFCGAPHKQISIGVLARNFAALVYHNVGRPQTGSYPEQTLSPVQFERHLAWLSHHGYAGVRLSRWIDNVLEGRALSSRKVLITFDDGYAALAEHAFPVLLKYGFHAGVFVVTDRLGKTNTWDEACGYESHALLSREEIVYWAARGIEFGAHGRTHADLTALGPAECEREVLGSRDELGVLLGHEPPAFAYPYGRFSPGVVATVRRAFPAAFSARRGLNTAWTDPHLLRRALVHPRDSLLDLRFLVHFGISPGALKRRLLEPSEGPVGARAEREPARSRWRRNATSR